VAPPRRRRGRDSARTGGRKREKHSARRQPSPCNLPLAARHGVDEAQVEHVARNDRLRAHDAHRQVVVLDQRELDGAATGVAQDHARVDPPRGLARGHIALVRLQEDVLGRVHARNIFRQSAASRTPTCAVRLRKTVV
jgi:hypothetical protein